ncbi:glycosyltransferase family 4 protein [Fibrobacter sp. UBA4297]|uniref:glycosyltransferase family 4 protein n=1 Tax=Fibrobacter sp. UBA4297 TaxID=1946536 RepID=UPI0025BA86C8|nr:glycosyltransferase family 4 protein [Fibrobacter sp. UBA4297]
MNICVVCSDYPSKKSSTFSFVKQLVDEFAEQGHCCFVVSPFSITRYKCFNKAIEIQKFKSGGQVVLIRPNYLSFSMFRIGHFCPTDFFQKQALKKAFKMLPIIPDVIYAHFWSSAILAFNFAKRNDIPLFVASGESSIPKPLNKISYQVSFCNYISGVICVSKKNKNESINLGLTSDDKCVVIPNAIDEKKFYKMDKKECRKKYDYPENAFIVAFVGWFNNRKGSNRVSEAIKKLNNPNIYSIFVGNGPDEPSCPNIIFKGNVKHEKLCSLLNCADIFVLPTLAEGCCNAIIEAMACNLPIISSDLSFNDELLDEGNSIRINSNSVEEIAFAINKLYNDFQLRESMAEGSLKKASNLTIDKRAKAIIQFIETRISGKTTNV